MRFFILLLLLPMAAHAGVHRQASADLIDPAIASPTHINSLPAAVEVTPVVVEAQPGTFGITPTAAQPTTMMTSTSVPVSASAVSGTVLQPELVAAGQCVAGLRVLTQLSLVGYDADPSKAFMRVAAAAAIAEPYAANGVPPNLKGLQSAIGDLPMNGTGVKEINQAFGITKTACAGIVKSK